MRIRSVILYIIPVILIVFYIILEISEPRPFDWKPGYSQSSREPMGCSALFELLPGMFPEKEVRTIKKDLYSFCRNDKDSGQNLIVITENFTLDASASEELVEWVGQGNTVFISASDFSYAFGGEAGFVVDRGAFVPDLEQKPVSPARSFYFAGEEAKPVAIQGPWDYCVLNPDSFIIADTLMMASSEAEQLPQPCFLRIPHEKGFILVHGAPYLFSNYVMHKTEALRLAELTISHLPVATTLWDEYYKPGNLRSEVEGMNVIFDRQSLRTAWQLMLLMMLLYILFVGKRQQRPIPIINPPENASVEYIRTLGRLYYEKRNNHDIIQKRLHFLLMAIRMKFSVHVQPDDPGFVRQLVLATNASEDEMKRIAWCYNRLRQGGIDTKLTLKISQEIDLFYEKYIH